MSEIDEIIWSCNQLLLGVLRKQDNISEIHQWRARQSTLTSSIFPMLGHDLKGGVVTKYRDHLIYSICIRGGASRDLPNGNVLLMTSILINMHSAPTFTVPIDLCDPNGIEKALSDVLEFVDLELNEREAFHNACPEVGL